ncbi:MAG: hypothetical protein AB8B61_01055, partial [Cyclobacteriaceae bacterium]
YELVGIARYKPLSKLSATGKLFYSKFGAEPTDTSNVGSNILLANPTRDSEYGNSIAQGASSQLFMLDLTLSYKLRNNWYIDLQQIYRKVTSDRAGFAEDTYFVNVGVRLHMAKRRFEF